MARPSGTVATTALLLALVLAFTSPVHAAVNGWCLGANSGGSHYEVFGHTVAADNADVEVQPTWDDCNALVEFLKLAGCSPTGWECDLKWGTCPVNIWGSCVHAVFDSAGCQNNYEIAAGISNEGLSEAFPVTNGWTPTGNVISAHWVSEPLFCP